MDLPVVDDPGPKPDHYAFCRDAQCTGCLPSLEELATRPTIALWGEMAQRCIAQTRATKTHEGALFAIRADDAEYRKIAAAIRKGAAGG